MKLGQQLALRYPPLQINLLSLFPSTLQKLPEKTDRARSPQFTSEWAEGLTPLAIAQGASPMPPPTFAKIKAWRLGPFATPGRVLQKLGGSRVHF
jgi:hypothetical protein